MAGRPGVMGLSIFRRFFYAKRASLDVRLNDVWTARYPAQGGASILGHTH